MRILTGNIKGREIPMEPDPDIRPTADKVRKAIFDTLQGYAKGKRVLDLYSGTGALGFEAFSTGAAYVRFVESHAPAAKRIERTLKKWGLSENAAVDAMETLRAVDRAAFRKDSYELVFLDPPYKANRGAETLKALADADIVAKGGFVVVETWRKEVLPEELAPFKLLRDRRYGQSRVAFYGRSSG